MIRVAVVIAALVAGLVALEAAVVRDAHHFTGAFAVVGLLGGAAIVGMAKLIGAVLQRPDIRDE